MFVHPWVPPIFFLCVDAHFFLTLASNPTSLVFAYQFLGAKWSFKTERVRFGDALAEMDDSIGQILDSISNLGIANNTLIFFTSDNG